MWGGGGGTILEILFFHTFMGGGGGGLVCQFTALVKDSRLAGSLLPW